MVAHNPKDGWKPITNDPTWPGPDIPVVPVPGRSLPVVVGGPGDPKDIHRLEKALVKLGMRLEVTLAIVEKLGARLDALEAWKPETSPCR
jgi:hypothetical protein